VTDELRPVVRTQVTRSAVRGNQACQHLDHPLGADRAGDIDGQAFPGELVDDRQAFKALPVSAAVEYEVIGPDVN
jgi:hypothetical protein